MASFSLQIADGGESKNNFTPLLAQFAFAGTGQAGELFFAEGDLLEGHKKEGDWWFGSLKGKEGWFPGNYVKEQETRSLQAASKGDDAVFLPAQRQRSKSATRRPKSVMLKVDPAPDKEKAASAVNSVTRYGVFASRLALTGSMFWGIAGLGVLVWNFLPARNPAAVRTRTHTHAQYTHNTGRHSGSAVLFIGSCSVHASRLAPPCVPGPLHRARAHRLPASPAVFPCPLRCLCACLGLPALAPLSSAASSAAFSTLDPFSYRISGGGQLPTIA